MAIVTAAIIAGVGAVAAGYEGSQAAQGAANTQAGAANQASQLQLSMNQQNIGRLLPWITGGTGANAQLMSALGIPGWQGGTTSPQARNTQLAQQINAAFPNFMANQSSLPPDQLVQYFQQTAPQILASGRDLTGNPLSQVALGTMKQIMGQASPQTTPVGAPGQATPQTGGVAPAVPGAPQGVPGATAAGPTGALPNQPGYGTGYSASTPGILTQPFNLSMFQQDPSYNWQLQQGLGALENQKSALGGVVSGNTMRDMVGYAEGLASTDYQQALGNYTNWQQQLYSMLGGPSQMGQTSAAGAANLGAGTAASVGSNIMGAGNALAAGQVGSANAWTGAASNAYNQYLMAQLLSQRQQPQTQDPQWV